MATFYPIEANINTVIATAGLADIIYLPNETITSQIIISNDCQILGQEYTIVDTRTQAIQDAVLITAPNPSVSGFTVLNDLDSGFSGINISNSSATIFQIESNSDIGFKIENCSGAEFETLKSENSNIGFNILNSKSNEFIDCSAAQCDVGFNLEGSSSIVGDTYGYQELGLSVIATDPSGLIDTTSYDIIINSVVYTITSGIADSYNNVVTLLNNEPLFALEYSASFVGDDIRIIKLSAGSINISGGTLLTALNAMVEVAVGYTAELDRLDRTHNNNFTSCIINENGIGIRYVNTNNNEFDNSKCFDNTNVGIQQNLNSYSNTFRGEVYGNAGYGIRNLDRTGGLHDYNAKSVWWGDITGPSNGGPGEGDKISNFVSFEPWLRSGTEPDLTYPVTRNWIWSMLGDPLVRVELTEQQVTDDIAMAVDKFMYYWAPEPYYKYMSLGEGTGEVMLPLEITKESIMEVTYQPHSDLFAQLSGSGTSFFLTYYMQQSGGTFLTDFYVAMSYKETFERVLGITPSWEFVTHPQDDNLPYNALTNPYRDFIRLYPRPDSGAINLALKVSRPLVEEEVDANTWIRKYALTWAKEQLSRVRGKFGSVPGPTGDISMNAGELMSEAMQDREALILDLIKRSEPLGFQTG